MKLEGGIRTKGYSKKYFYKEPKVSIITATFNSENYLEETILSIINQTYCNIEYIIIDGGSFDGTIDIIKKYEDKIDYWVSEPDKGISDAFNKGIKSATGDYINFQGDGDGFYSIDSLEKVFQDIDSKKDIFIAGRIQRIDENGKELFLSKFIKKFKKQSLLLRMSLPHQGLFTKKIYFENYGLFDIENRYCMDYEHLLRSYHDFPKVVTKDIIVAKWRADGLGNGKTLEILKEYDIIKRKNKVSKEKVLNIINNWLLFKYQIKSLLIEDL